MLFRSLLGFPVTIRGEGGGGTAGANYGLQGYAGEFNSGGGFKVGGTGAGRDTTAVAFRANRGERVTVETKKQQRQNDNGITAANVNVPVSITNVFYPTAMISALDSSEDLIKPYDVNPLLNFYRVNRSSQFQLTISDSNIFGTSIVSNVVISDFEYERQNNGFYQTTYRITLIQ